MITPGINVSPLNPIAKSLTDGNVQLLSNNRLPAHLVPEVIVPSVPFYPTVQDYASVVNPMARIYKILLDAMPQKFEAAYINPNPERVQYALPSPQLGLSAVVEIDTSNYRGIDNGY